MIGLVLGASYIAYLKSTILSKDSWILSVPQMFCFAGSILLGLASILILLTDGIIGITHRIQRFRTGQAKRRV